MKITSDATIAMAKDAKNVFDHTKKLGEIVDKIDMESVDTAAAAAPAAAAAAPAAESVTQPLDTINKEILDAMGINFDDQTEFAKDVYEKIGIFAILKGLTAFYDIW